MHIDNNYLLFHCNQKIVCVYKRNIVVYLENTFRKALTKISRVIFPSGLEKKVGNHMININNFLSTKVAKIQRAFLVIYLHPYYRFHVEYHQFVVMLILQRKHFE
mgnify:CR=1 FL=1